MIELFPDRADEFRQRQEQIRSRLREAKCCLGCGRSLKAEESIDSGYGSECLAKLDV